MLIIPDMSYDHNFKNMTCDTRLTLDRNGTAENTLVSEKNDPSAFHNPVLQTTRKLRPKTLEVLTCEHCGTFFNERKDLTTHIVEHTQKKPYQCPHCRVAFKHKGSLVLHIKIHRIRICPICAGAFSDNAALRKHVRLHKTPLTCRICSKSFASKVSFEAHKLIHSGRKPFTCRLCSKTFLYKSTLSNHMTIHNKFPQPKLLICELCGRRYCYLSELIRHKKHHDVSAYSCRCPFCGKCFALKTTLNTHLKLHGARKLFRCALCESAYLKKPILEKHLLRDHFREKPLVGCEKCPKVFYTNYELRRHWLDHLKAKT